MPRPVPRPCACGGEPIAPTDTTYEAIVWAIREHAQTDQRHLAWQARLFLARGPLAAATGVDTRELQVIAGGRR